MAETPGVRRRSVHQPAAADIDRRAGDVAGMIGGEISAAEVGELPANLMTMVFVGGGAGLAMIVFARFIRRWMGGIR